jgi:hypothetical protein
MDKPLGALRGLLIGTAMLAAALYAVSVLPGVGGAQYLAAYLRTVWERERIEEDKTVIFRTAQLRKEIIARLVQGSLSLQEAADAVRDDFESRPERLRPCYPPDVPPEERYPRTVLAWVQIDLSDDPRRDEVLKRLRAELRANRVARARSVPADTPRSQTATATTE